MRSLLKPLILFIYLLTISPFSYGQDPVNLDSLYKAYEQAKNEDEAFEVLRLIVTSENDPEKKLTFSELLEQKGLKDSSYHYLQIALLQKGNALQLKGDYGPALEAYFKCIEYSRKLNDQQLADAVLISIADTYSMTGNTATAESYYSQGIEGLRKSDKDSIKLASALLNAGDAAFNSSNYQKALDYFKESGEIFKIKEYPLGSAYNLGNEGMVYANLGQDKLAENNIDKAISILEDLEQFYPISVYLTYMAEIYKKKGDYQTAISFSNNSLELATKYGLKDQIAEANLQLSNLYAEIGNYEQAYLYYQDHISFRDSITNINTVQEMANIRTDYEVSQKQTELDLLAQKKRTQDVIVIATVVAAVLLMLLAFGLYRRNNYINRTTKIIEKERNRSDKLLLNILPEDTAKELKAKGKVKTQSFDSVSVLFTDFKDFTRFAENVSPEVLVESVDYYFSKFDEIIEKYELEKIKTVGDSYMCAGGLPFPSKDHAYRSILGAMEIIDFVNATRNDKESKILPFEIRIGINTGPVVAGVVGRKKFAYDIWGDTVNIASRMESSSEPGRINISENTFNLVKDHFNFDYRGQIKVKNKGMMKMFFLSDSLEMIHSEDVPQFSKVKAS